MIEFKLNYLGFGMHESACQIYFLNTRDRGPICIVTDLGTGTSITNAAEQIYPALKLLLAPRKNITFVECYIIDGTRDLSIVTFNKNRPAWAPANQNLINFINNTLPPVKDKNKIDINIKRVILNGFIDYLHKYVFTNNYADRDDVENYLKQCEQ